MRRSTAESGSRRSMMRALAERAVDLGDVVSALYPATVAPYRRTGWEIVGAQTRITIDSHHLRGLGASDVRPRPGTKTDAEHDGGFVFYEWHGSDLSVSCLVASSEASARALRSVVGSGSSVAKRSMRTAPPTTRSICCYPRRWPRTPSTRAGRRGWAAGVHRSPPLSRGSARSWRGGRVGPRGYSRVLRVRMGKQAWPTTNGNRGTRA